MPFFPDLGTNSCHSFSRNHTMHGELIELLQPVRRREQLPGMQSKRRVTFAYFFTNGFSSGKRKLQVGCIFE